MQKKIIGKIRNMIASGLTTRTGRKLPGGKLVFGMAKIHTTFVAKENLALSVESGGTLQTYNNQCAMLQSAIGQFPCV